MGRPPPQGDRPVTPTGGDAPQPPWGTLSPLVPLSLRAYKGEGERRTEADVGALHPRRPLVQYWGGGGGNASRPPWGTLTPLVPLSLRAIEGEGEKKQRQAPAPRRRRLPLVWYWGGGNLAPDSSRGLGMGREGGWTPGPVRSVDPLSSQGQALRLRLGRAECPTARGWIPDQGRE